MWRDVTLCVRGTSTMWHIDRYILWFFDRYDSVESVLRSDLSWWWWWRWSWWCWWCWWFWPFVVTERWWRCAVRETGAWPLLVRWDSSQSSGRASRRNTSSMLWSSIQVHHHLLPTGGGVGEKQTLEGFYFFKLKHLKFLLHSRNSPTSEVELVPNLN